jgi:cellulose biosynthesis protein BcsQ
MQSDYPSAAALLGTVANRAIVHTVLGRDMLASMQGRADLKMFDAVIPATVRVEEAALLQTTINDYEPTSAAALAFEQLTEEILHRGK